MSLRTELRSINTKFEAIKFLIDLHFNGEAFNPDDPAKDVDFGHLLTAHEKGTLQKMMDSTIKFCDAHHILLVLNRSEGDHKEADSFNEIFTTADPYEDLFAFSENLSEVTVLLYMYSKTSGLLPGKIRAERGLAGVRFFAIHIATVFTIIYEGTDWNTYEWKDAVKYLVKKYSIIT